MSRETWNQVAVVLAIIVAVGGTAWTVSKSYGELESKVAANEHDIMWLKGEIERVTLDQQREEAKDTASNDRLAHDVEGLQATWNLMLKELPQFRPHSR